MYPRSWKDQPEACEAMPVVATFPVGPRRMWGEDSLFDVLNIAGSGRAEASLPRNVTVVE